MRSREALEEGEGPVKVAVFHDLPPGGGLRLARDFCRGLKAKGHRIELHVLSGTDDGLFAIAPHSSRVLRYRPPRCVEPFPGMRPYVAWRSAELARRILFLCSLGQRHRAIARAIDGEGYDLAFVQSCRHTQAPWLLRFLRAPTAYFANEPLRVVYDAAPDEPPRARGTIPARWSERWGRSARAIERELLERIDRKNVAGASCLLTSSRHTRERLSQCYGLQAKLCPPGVDLDLFRPAGVERRNQVVSVGSIWPHKNHRLTIEALGLVEPALRPELVLVSPDGSAEHLEELRILAAEADVRLVVRTNVPEEALIRAYRQSLALVYVARSEPFGLAAVEAMACGTPVVAVEEGGLPESVLDGETGLLIRPEASECAAAIRRLVQDPDLRKRLGLQARAHVERRWGFETSIDRLEAALRSVAGSRRR